MNSNGYRVTQQRIAGVLVVAICLAFAFVGLVLSLGSTKWGSLMSAAVAWLSLALLNAYWWLWLVGDSLEIVDDSLRWCSVLRTRTFPLAKVKAIHPTRFPSRLILIEVAGKPTVLVFYTRELRRFAVTLRASLPGVRVLNSDPPTSDR